MGELVSVLQFENYEKNVEKKYAYLAQFCKILTTLDYITLKYDKIRIEIVQIRRFFFHSELQAMSHQRPRCRNIRRVSFSTYFWIFCAFSQLSWLFAKAFSHRERILHFWENNQLFQKKEIRSKGRESSNRAVRHLVIF